MAKGRRKKDPVRLLASLQSPESADALTVPSQRTLPSLTSLRFFAALIVVLYHFGLYLPPFAGFGLVSSLGYTGVTFFFVLSGFVLTWSYRDGDRALEFYGRRFARVWPLHAACTLAIVAIFFLIGTEQSAVKLSAVTLLLQSWLPPGEYHYAYNGPSWTLSCEMFFYLAFPMLIVFVRRISFSWMAPFLVVLSTIVVIATLAIAPLLAPTLGVSGEELYGYTLYVFPAYRIIEFVLGITLGVAVRRGWRLRLDWRLAALICAVAYILISVGSAVVYDGDSSRLPYGVADLFMLVPFCLLIVSAAVRDIRGGDCLLTRRVFIVLGSSSFALYLVHEGVIRYGGRLLVGWNVPLVATIALCALSMLILAFVLHKVVEVPLERQLRRRLRRSVV